MERRALTVRRSKTLQLQEIVAEIHSELRSIIRTRESLYEPIRWFQKVVDRAGETWFYVQFDMKPRQQVTGLKLGGGLPHKKWALVSGSWC
jgi:hypothetical protein